MKIGSKTVLSVMVLALIVAGWVISGCAQPTPPAQSLKGNEYDIPKEAQITQVTWYLGDQGLCVDVKLKNVAATAMKFDVAVNVDGGGYFFAGLEAGKEVKAGAEQVYKTQSSLTTPYPKTLQIRVVPR